MSEFKKSIISGFFWSFLGQSGYLIIGLIANIILTRLLSPVEFGQVGIIMFFIIIAKVLTESGLAGALIRKNDATADDFSTIFIFNLVISIFLMLILISLSGSIAEFYNDPKLENILIASSFIIIINAFHITQNAKLVKELKFKKKAKYELIAIIFAAITGISLALNNAGVWALVVMQLTTALILTILLWTFEGPLKSYIFKWESFKEFYKFGVNTSLSLLLITAFDNIYQLILGRFFSIIQTGLYYQGKKLQEIPMGVMTSLTYGVVYSSLVKVKDDDCQFNNLYKRITTVFTVIVAMICLLIFFYVKNIILLLYGEKWIGAAFYAQILIVSSFFYMQEVFNLNIFRVFNKTEKILHLEIVKKTIQCISIIIGVITKSIDILLYGMLIVSFLSFLLNYYYSKKIQNNFSWTEFFIILKVALVAVLTLIFGYMLMDWISLKGYYSFVLIPYFIIAFLLLLYIFKIFNVQKELRIIYNLIKK